MRHWTRPSFKFGRWQQDQLGENEIGANILLYTVLILTNALMNVFIADCFIKILPFGCIFSKYYTRFVCNILKVAPYERHSWLNDNCKFDKWKKYQIIKISSAKVIFFKSFTCRLGFSILKVSLQNKYTRRVIWWLTFYKLRFNVNITNINWLLHLYCRKTFFVSLIS